MTYRRVSYNKRRRTTTRRNTSGKYVRRRSYTKSSYVRAAKNSGNKIIRQPRFVMYNQMLQSKVRTKLTYCDTKTLAASNNSSVHSYRLNSIYDPDWSGVGHQPAFHDRWNLMYQFYRVYACKWSLTFTPSCAQATSLHAAGGTATGETHPVSDTSALDQTFNPALVCWEVSTRTVPDLTEAADLNIFREIGNGMKNVGYRHTGVIPKPITLTGYSRMVNLFESKDLAEVATAQGGDPDELIYLHLVKMSKDGGTAAAYRVDIKLDYYVEYTRPIDEQEN